MNTRDLEDVYELTPLQRGILFHSLYAPNSGVYVEQAYLTFRGKLDHDAFWEAWQAVADRHPAIRSSYHWDGITNPVQAVHKKVRIERHEVDWRDVPASEWPQRIESFLLEERNRGFDLERPPLLRITLFRLAEDRFYLAWRISHLIADGWSFGILLSEFITLYRTYYHGSDTALPAPGLFRDYVAWWQRQDKEIPERYWRDYLEGYAAPDPLDLGRAEEVPEGAVPYEREELSLGDIADELRGFVSAHRLTLHTVIQSAWMLVLSRCGQNEEVMVGATMAHRPTDLDKEDRIVGPMVVTLPVRSKVDDCKSLLSWLHEVQTSIVDARENAGAPLTDIHGWSPVPRSSALFESIVSFENVPIPEISFPDEGLELLDYAFDGRPQYPLSFVVLPGDDLPLRLIYDRRRFRGPAVKRMLERVRATLRLMLSNPGGSVGGLDILTSEEREQLESWRRPTRRYAVDKPLHCHVSDHASARGAAVALTGEGRPFTYREMDELGNQLARHLRRLGVGPGSRVALCGERRPSTVLGMLGILKSGAAFVPLEPTHPAERLAYIVSDAGASVLLTESDLLDVFADQTIPTVCLDRDWSEITVGSTGEVDVGTSPGDEAYVVYTSGSTGTPKGVAMTHANVVRLVHSMDDVLDVGPDDVWTCFHAFAFDASVWEIWGALLHGSRLVVVPHWMTRSPEAFYSSLVAEQVTVGLQTPRAFEQLIAAESQVDDAESGSLALRYLLVGADRVDPKALRPWFERHGDHSPEVLNVYGPTETTVFCTVHRITLDETKAEIAASNIGRPIADTVFHLLDARLRPVPIGVAGEIYISGPGLGCGYVNLPETTAETFLPDPFAESTGAYMYRTGDLARYDAAGEIEYLGRIDNQVKIRGFRVELGEIEAVLRDHPDIRNAAVTLRKRGADDVQLAAYIVTENSAPGAAGVRAALRRKLPEYMVPSTIIPVETIPLTANGKLDTSALPGIEDDVHADSPFVEPRTDTERHLAELMRDVLGRDRIGAEDNLVDLGLHSLIATGVIARIRDQWKVSVPLRALFECPTVVALARIIEEGGADDTAPNRPGQVDLPGEVSLPDDVRAATATWGGTTIRADPSRIFLTGATGFLGGALLERLLLTTGATVHCLVRADSEEDGMRRLVESLRGIDLWDEAYTERIVPVLGNLASASLGVTSDVFDDLSQQIDEIYHCGALVNFLHPYRRLRAANVTGTQEVLRLGASGRTAPVHYVSTGAVLGQLDRSEGPAEPAKEVELAGSPPRLSGGYAESKWVAERIVTLARDRGLPVTVHRSGRVTGYSQNGQWKAGDATSEMMRACLNLGLVPDFDGVVDMTPVDYVCGAITTLARSAGSVGQIFHLTNPVPVDIDTLAAGMQRAGYAARKVSVREWYSALLRFARRDHDQDWTAALAVLGTWVHNYQNGREEPRYDCSAAMAQLGDAVQCPRVDEDLIATYVRHFAAIGYVPQPGGQLARGIAS